jgi:hypothetical protein
MTMFDVWEYERLKTHVDGLVQEADANLNGHLALEPNDPQRETQVNHWTEELRKAHALRTKLDGLKP